MQTLLNDRATLSLLAAFFILLGLPTTAEVTLSGQGLTVEEVVRVARFGERVRIDEKALLRMDDSHHLLLRAAAQGIAVYGLNRGVGLNKDKTIFSGDVVDPDVRRVSEKFNRALIYAHCAGVGPPASEEVVRAAMVVRLNTLLVGHSGAQRHLAERLAEFLNYGVHPVVPSRGSIGEADITLLGHVGLAMIGEGEVTHKGRTMKARKALALYKWEPLSLFAKDALSLFSSNAYSAGWACLVVSDSERILTLADLVYCVSLEGFDGNVAPLLSEVQDIRPFPGQRQTSRHLRGVLQGSYLWDRATPSRQLQDPLSFRTVSQVHGAVRDTLETLREQITLQINSSDDNPTVVLDVKPRDGASQQEQAYFVQDGKVVGAVIPTANFSPLSWTLTFETLGIGLTHVSHMSAERMTRLGDEHFTLLTRFLAPNPETIGFAAIQKAYVALDTENRALCRPVSTDSFPVAGGVEDHATNAPIVVGRVGQIVENLNGILGIELMHGAQAVDLRGDVQLGRDSGAFYRSYRERVPFLDRDRPLTPEIEASRLFLKDWEL